MLSRNSRILTVQVNAAVRYASEVWENRAMMLYTWVSRGTIVSGALRGVLLSEQRSTEGRLWPGQAKER